MHAMLCTQPDIYFAASLVSRYQSNPELAHWQAVKWIMHYLRSVANLVYRYQGEDLKFEGYSDANWGGDPDESRLTLGYALPWVGEPCYHAVRSDTAQHRQLWRHIVLLVTIGTKVIVITYMYTNKMIMSLWLNLFVVISSKLIHWV